MRFLTPLLLTASLYACAVPPASPAGATAGDNTLANRGGFVMSVSASFSGPELETLYKAMTNDAFRTSLSEFNCGEPLPNFRFFLRLEPEGEVNERIVHVAVDPSLSPGGHERCLSSGLSYVADITLFDIDRGEPINYHYRDPMTGKELAPRARRIPRKPVCDCSARDSGKEWVEYPIPAPGEKTE